MSKTVAILDDNPDFVQLAIAILEEHEFQVHVVVRDRDVAAMFDGLRCDVLISDLYMPDVDGIEVVRWFKRNRPGVPVIVASGQFDQLPRAEQMLRAFGADAVIPKFATPDELAESVQRVLDPSARSAAEHR